MVDVVNDEMVGGVGDLAVHFDAFAVFFSRGVECSIGTLCKPGELAHVRIVIGIDDGEFSASEWYKARGAVLGIRYPILRSRATSEGKP